MKNPLTILLCFSITLLSLLLSCNRADNLNRRDSAFLLDTNEYKKDLFVLSSDSMEGRRTGTEGGIRAANYIASRFKQLGLIPISGDQGYFQQVNIESYQPDYSTAKVSIKGQKFEEKIDPCNEILLISREDKPSVDIEGDLVFVGYGIVAPEYNWDDYKGTDVKGKIVVCLWNHPDFKSPGYLTGQTTYYGFFHHKSETAFRKGAKGIIFIFQGFNFIGWQNFITNISFGDYSMDSKIPLVSYVTESAFNRIAQKSYMNISDMIKVADGREFKPFPLAMHMKATFGQNIKKYESPNVVGYVKGTTKPDEAFIYMAHYDHLGIMRPVQGDSIYNGAIDNASGTAGIITLANYFSAHPPERSVIFLASTAEETFFQGVLHYLMHPLIPLEKTFAGVNIDMMDFLGPTDSIYLSTIQYTDAFDTIKNITDKMHISLKLSGIDKGYYNFRMESYPFALHDVLMMWLGFEKIGNHHFSLSDNQVEEIKRMGGLNYHKPSDELKPWFRYDGILQQLELAKNIGLYYANEGRKPVFNSDNPYLPARKMWVTK